MKILFLVILLHSTLIFPQKNLDSLISSISNMPDTTQIKILTDYCWKNRSQNPHLALRSGEAALKLSEKIEDLKLQAKSLNLLGVIHRNLGEYDKSLNAYNAALKLAEISGDSTQVAFSNNNIGGIYRLEGNNTLALQYILRALKTFENINHKEGIAFCTINVGLIYRRQKNYLKALEYLNYTLRLRNEIGDKPGRALALNLIAEVHFDMGDIKTALRYYYEVEKDYSEVNDKKGLAATWGGIGAVYLIEGNYKKALEYRLRALDMSEKISYLEGQVINHSSLGIIYAKLGNFTDAEKNMNSALSIAEGMKEIYVQIECYKYMVDYLEVRKNFQQALFYNKKYQTLRDSVLNEEKITLVSGMEAVYLAEKKEKENTVLLKDVELKEKQRNYLLIMAVLVIAIALAVYSRYYSKKKDNIKLAELNKMKDTFLKVIAHDLKAPFSSIFGFTEMLLTDYEKFDDKEKMEFILSIDKASKQSYQLLENLLMWSQANTGNIAFDPQKIKISEIIKSTFHLLQHTALKKGINLSWNCESEIELRADKNMLSTVIRNLVSNGLKYTEGGGYVKVMCSKENSSLLITVEDSGIGMSQKTVDLLFGINKVISKNGTAGEQGTGLGLLLCKDFVEKHGGKIRVESELNKGSKFFVMLPAIS